MLTYPFVALQQMAMRMPPDVNVVGASIQLGGLGPQGLPVVQFDILGFHDRGAAAELVAGEWGLKPVPESPSDDKTWTFRRWEDCKREHMALGGPVRLVIVTCFPEHVPAT